MSNHLFKPGHTKVAGSGMQQGQKTKKVQERDNEMPNLISLISRLTREYAGMTVEEKLIAFGYDPIVAAMVFGTAKSTPDATRQKYNDAILARTIPTLAKEEVQTENLIVVRYEGYGFDQPPAIEAAVVPAIESGSPSGPLTMFDNPNEVLAPTVPEQDAVDMASDDAHIQQKSS